MSITSIGSAVRATVVNDKLWPAVHRTVATAKSLTWLGAGAAVTAVGAVAFFGGAILNMHPDAELSGWAQPNTFTDGAPDLSTARMLFVTLAAGGALAAAAGVKCCRDWRRAHAAVAKAVARWAEIAFGTLLAVGAIAFMVSLWREEPALAWRMSALLALAALMWGGWTIYRTAARSTATDIANPS